MNNWLVIWKTWLEDDIDTPWPFQLIEHTTEFRSRIDPAIRIPEDLINSLYLSQDPETIERFELEHVSAVVLCTMLSADEPDSALADVKLIFPDCEFVSCMNVPDELLDSVNAQLKKDQRRMRR